MVYQKDYIGHRQRIKDRFWLGRGKDMADYEFLELILTLAIPRKDTKPLAKALIERFGSFAGVMGAKDADLMEFCGLKRSTLLVFGIVREAALRMSWENLCNEDRPILADWDRVLDYCRMKLGNCSEEQFMLIMLNDRDQVIYEEVQQRGTVNCVAVHPREVVNSAILHKATQLIMVHNHPSGSVKPSGNDKLVTAQSQQALQAVGVTLIDHLIISKSAYYSFRDHDLL